MSGGVLCWEDNHGVSFNSYTLNCIPMVYWNLGRSIVYVRRRRDLLIWFFGVFFFGYLRDGACPSCDSRCYRIRICFEKVVEVLSV